jgi:hypothetical protein
MVDNNMERSQVKVAVIPLKPDYDEAQVRRMKKSESRETNGIIEKITIEIPILSIDAGTYEFLTFIREFTRASEILGWTTGPKLCEHFETLLQGYHRQTWSEEANAVGTQTVQHFAEALTGFKSQLLENEDYDDQMDYIRQSIKPHEMNPGKFLGYLRMQNTMVQDLPGSTGGFTDIQLRRIFLHAMPAHWQSKFQDANKTSTDTTLNEMRTYFEKQHARDPYTSTTVPYQKIDSDKSSENSDNVDNQDITADNQGTFADSHDAPSPSADNQGRITNMDQCPLPNHHGHLWGLCRQNKYNDASLSAHRSSDTPAHPYNTRSSAHATPDPIESHFQDPQPDAEPEPY